MLISHKEVSQKNACANWIARAFFLRESEIGDNFKIQNSKFKFGNSKSLHRKVYPI